eukprot:GFYU01000187.1.p1 GENE.GFYU01000187.1~~GFYU01000187.1.p1  ORF type:complete len:431 (+),score=123.98 GFYU01000187.1:112-1404(+)
MLSISAEVSPYQSPVSVMPSESSVHEDVPSVDDAAMTSSSESPPSPVLSDFESMTFSEKSESCVLNEKYRLGEVLGEGLSGFVRLATHVETGDKYAVKLVPKYGDAETEKNIERLRREIAILEKVQHPHLLKLIEVIETGVWFGFAMQFYTGGDLFGELDTHGSYREEEARRLFKQILSGVEHMHQHKILHGDIKPENLLFDSERNLVLADMGSAVDMSLSSVVKGGSLNYSAPELLQGADGANPGLDIWSLGVTLFVMVTGYFPFNGDTDKDLVDQISAGQYELPPYISRNVRDLLSHMLDVNPETRFSAGQVAQHAWLRHGRGGGGILEGLRKERPQLSVTTSMAKSPPQEVDSPWYMNDDEDLPNSPPQTLTRMPSLPVDPEALAPAAPQPSHTEGFVATENINREDLLSSSEEEELDEEDGFGWYM